ncbi:MAG: RNA 2',3'-cyclic phosphodiesterase [Thermoplasmata archaeon]|nr:MAG: RNA 2',3'-cyclic phosphodiesterase [Thermoplasmata archaeon]
MPFRAFIAVDIGPMPELVKLSEELKATKADLKLVEPENIHITLKFLGDTDEVLVEQITGQMIESSRGIQPFELRFEKIGAFPNINYLKVIWVGLEGATPLVQISRKLDSGLRSLGFKSDKKGFKPHITLARVRSPRGKSELKNVINAHSSDFFGTLNVNKIILKKSVLSPAGPTYTDISVVDLSDANDEI